MKKLRDDVLVQIGMTDEEVKKKIKDLKQRFAGLAKSIAAAAKKMTLLAAAAIAAGGALLTHLVRNSLEAVDAQAKLARQIGGTTESIQVLTRAADLSGLSVADLTGNLQRLNRRLGEALDTGGPAADTLDQLGLSAMALSESSPDERIAKIADAIAELPSEAERAAAAFDLFGDGGLRMIEVLAGGSDLLERARRDVEDFGVALSDVDAHAIEAANDAISTFGLIVTGVSNQLAAALAPVLQTVSDRLTDSARGTKGFREEIEGLIASSLTGFGTMLDFLADVEFAFKRVTLIGARYAQLQANLVRMQAEAMNFVFGGLAPETFDAIMTSVRDTATQATAAVQQLSGEVAVLRYARPPSEWVDGLVADIEDARVRLAETGAAALGIPSNDNFSGDPGGGGGDSETDAARLGAELDAFDDFLADKEDRERRSFEKRREELDAFLAAGVVDEAGYRERLAALEMQHQEAMAAIRDGGAAERFARLEEDLLSEEERQLAHYQNQLATLADALARQLVTQEDAAALAEQIEREHMDRLVAIREAGMTDLEKLSKASYQDQAKFALDELSSLTAGVARENKKMFQVNKAVAIANAVLKAQESVVSSYAWGARIGGPPLGAIAAATAAAATFAQVRALQSASFNSGAASSPSAVATTPATPVSNVPASSNSGGQSGGSGNVINLTLNGQNFTRSQVLELMEAMNEALGDGARLNVA